MKPRFGIFEKNTKEELKEFVAELDLMREEGIESSKLRDKMKIHIFTEGILSGLTTQVKFEIICKDLQNEINHRYFNEK